MIPMQRMLAIVTCLGALAVTSTARAQPSDSKILLDAPAFVIKKPRPGAPEMKARPLTWPRLDPGSVLCRSEADLARLAQRRSGLDVDGQADCQIVRIATGITIVQRKGPGRTEVKPSDAQPMELGWTDAWLPEKTPAGAASAMR
jgi:hypothetical protein